MCFYQGDYDSGTFLSKTTPVARKPHRCVECMGTVAPGDRYTRYSWAFEGSAGSDCVCGRCERIRSLIHDLELAAGCQEYESWAPVGEIDLYLEQERLTYDAASDRLVLVEKGGRWDD